MEKQQGEEKLKAKPDGGSTVWGSHTLRGSDRV